MVLFDEGHGEEPDWVEVARLVGDRVARFCGRHETAGFLICARHEVLVWLLLVLEESSVIVVVCSAVWVLVLHG